VLLDQNIEIHRVEIFPARVRESGDVSGRDSSRDPLDEFFALVGCASFTATLCDFS
jgi:hypothetical protein